MAGLGGSLVGREHELAVLGALLEEAEGGRGRAVVVLGEAGIGKTALVEALAGGAAELGIAVAWGRCAEADAPVFWPWRQAFRVLGSTVLAEASSVASRPELFAQVVDELAAAGRPALLALEDIHWADAASLALLRFVIDALPGLPLLLVATSRESPMEASPEATDLLRSLPPGVERLALSGLDPEAVTELVAKVLGYPPATELTARIAGRCAGNPFFVREVARLHTSRGAGATPTVPPGVQQVLERRLARLSQPCRDLMSVAAVAGEPEPDLLAEVVAEAPAEVLHRLSEAVDARLLVADGQDLRFAHALVREAVQAQQPPATLGDLHRRIADALEPQLETMAARLAVHWRQAVGEHARRIAAARALAAAREARGRMGFEQAVRFYEWALESPPEDALTIRIELGESQILAGALTAGRETLRSAARDALRAGRPREVARAVLGTGVGGFEVALQDDEQVALLEQALAGLTSPTDDGLRAAVFARLSLASAELRPPDDRIGLAEDSVALARAVGDAATEVAALAAWYDARSGPDHTEARLERADQMITAAQRSGDPASLLLARRLRLVALAECGDFPAVDAEIAAYARTADRLRLPLYSWPLPIWRGAQALMAGDLDATQRHLAEAEELAVRADSVNAAMLARVLKLWLFDVTGERERMGAVTDELLALVGLDHPHAGAIAGFYAGAGRLDDARRILRRQLAAGIETVPRDAEWLALLWMVGKAAIALGDTEAAAAVYDAMRPYAQRWVIDGIFATCLGFAAHQFGRLAAFLGNRDEAASWLEQAYQAHQAAGASLLVAQTEQALAELAGPARRPDAPTLAGELRRSGRVWQVRWARDSATVPDLKGMRDLAVLLASPDREVHVLDLVEAAGGPSAAAAGGHVGERLDRTARTAYRQRLADLENELAEAEGHSDAGRIAALREEQQFLAAELAGALGLGGRARTEGDPVERARKSVNMRIRTAIKAIAEVSPDLARHLDRSVTTGRLCAYRPERPVRWHLG